MPYTPLDQTTVLWDAQGPYWASVDGRSKHYIPPIAAAQYRDDPRMLEWAKSQGFELQRDAQGEITGMNQAPGAGAGGNRPLDFRTGRTWDTKRGGYRTSFDWGDIVTLGVGGLLAGPAIAGAYGGGGGAAAGTIAAPTAAESAAGIASLTGSGLAGGTAGGTAAALGVAPGSVISGITPALGGSGLTAAPVTAPAAGAATTGGTSAALGGNMAPLASGSIPGATAATAPTAAQTIAGGSQGTMAGPTGSSGYSGITRQLGGDTMQRLLGSAGQGISGATQASATNRGVQLDAELEAAILNQRQREAYQDQLLQRSRDDRESLSDAFVKSVQANRVLNSTGYQPAMLSQRPGTAPTALPNFGTGFAAPTTQQRGDASALYNEASRRLAGGSQLPKLEEPTLYQNNPNLMKPGAGEKIGSWLGPILTGLGAFRK